MKLMIALFLSLSSSIALANPTSDFLSHIGPKRIFTSYDGTEKCSMQVTVIGSISRIILIKGDHTFTYSLRDTSYTENTPGGFYSSASGLNGDWRFTVVDFETHFRAIGLFFNESKITEADCHFEK